MLVFIVPSWKLWFDRKELAGGWDNQIREKMGEVPFFMGNIPIMLILKDLLVKME